MVKFYSGVILSVKQLKNTSIFNFRGVNYYEKLF